jgi:YHS domain-containing protein
MQTIRSVVTGLTIVALAAITASAGDVKDEAKDKAPVEQKNQTHCPVMGGEIDSTVYTDIQGQRVYHCCPGCSESLKAEPDKYFKKAAEKGVLFENIQTACPVGGEELKEKSIYYDYEGRRLFFCGADCRAAFQEDPRKHLSGMDGKPRAVKNKHTKVHEGHGHSCQGHS